MKKNIDKLSLGVSIFPLTFVVVKLFCNTCG